MPRRVLWPLITGCIMIIALSVTAMIKNHRVYVWVGTFISGTKQEASNDFSPTKEEFRSYFELSKGRLLEKLGDGYEIVGAGAEGSYDGYRYEKPDLTFIFENNKASYIECGNKVVIGGARAGMNFVEIERKLGKRKIIKSWIETPDNVTYQIKYEFNHCIFEFTSFDRDGRDSTLGVYWIDVKDYQSYLDFLDKKDIRSFGNGVAYYMDNYSQASPKIREEAFIVFMNHYIGYVSRCPSVSDALSISGEPDARFEMLCAKNGFVIDDSEGDKVFAERPDFLLKTFGPYLSSTMKEYLTLRRNDLQQGLWGGGSLLIGFPELGDRLSKWEDFRIQHPDFVLKREVKRDCEMYRILFLQGFNYLPVFEEHYVDDQLQYGELVPEAKKAYEDFLSLNRKAPSTRIVEEFFEIIKANGCQYGDYVEQFYKEHHIRTIRDFWDESSFNQEL